MVVKRFLVRRPDGYLMGWSEIDQAWVTKLAPGECVEGDFRKARNPKHHAKFFALLQTAFRAQGKHKNLTSLLIELKIRCGWYDEHITEKGELVYIPRSISWARMDQDTFEEFYRAAVIELADMCGTDEIVAEADQLIARECRL